MDESFVLKSGLGKLRANTKSRIRVFCLFKGTGRLYSFKFRFGFLEDWEDESVS
jgi:hypothetical protein